ncbi:hypothetical protein C2E23DRAFT_889285 [Lenzites betulinus]|nr:hypothetical protein C2E23DRAFT_889285 [Lenzites betulinus]
MQLAAIVQTAFLILAAATAIQGATTVTLPAPTTTVSAPSATPTSVTPAGCRTNLECCEVVEPPPTGAPPIIGIPFPIQFSGPLIGLECTSLEPILGVHGCDFIPVCCSQVFTDGILVDGCVPVIDG